jgi:hypothetical protein
MPALAQRPRQRKQILLEPASPDDLMIHQYQSHPSTVVITRSIAALFGNLKKI